MPKRSSKDLNEAAYDLVQKVTQGDAQKASKNPAAVALGKLGGLKGGKARAAKLSAKRRSAIARKAAFQRWSNKNL
ncbi:MAG: hypothetical protein DME24_15745 [Verrucomicrobia bacterium]|nr:MAG: hypothetical protein DME24_15745 [Verrucomicrobiota bacterium]